jgi:sodium-dependent dicarboxylate transporter 2/3/5
VILNDSRRATLLLYRTLRLNLLLDTSTFIGNLVIALALTWLFRQIGYGNAVDYVFLITVLAVGLWITEAVPPFAVGILIVCMLVFGLGSNFVVERPQSIQIYTATWTSNVIWLLLGGFFLAEGLKEAGLDRELFDFTIRRFGNSPARLLFGMMFVTAFSSMIMSNTATTAMMVSSVLPLIRHLGKNSGLGRALLVGIPAAATIGGMGTIIGSTPNAIAVGALAEKSIRITFLDWMVVALPASLLLLYAFYRLLVWRMALRLPGVQLSMLPTENRQIEPAKRSAVLSTFALTVVLWATEPLHAIPVAATSAVPILLLTLTQVIRAEQVRALPWDTLMLVAGGLALGLALVEVGLARIAMTQLQQLPLSTFALAFCFSTIAVLLSNVMSNTAAASILVPVAIALPEPYGTATPIIVALSCSCALLLPVSTPSNAIAYATGYIEQKAFRLGGVFFALVGPVTAFGLVLLWVWLYLKR